MAGPLTGTTIVELAGLGPGPFACMLLADLGADVIRIDRPGGPTIPSAPPEFDLLNRGKRSIVLDLKRPEGVAAALRILTSADALVEGFRPGVAERLGLGPTVVQALNPKLVYGRMTGWGQDGPLAPSAGHDVNYIALTGALHAIGSAEGPPLIPLNLVGDLGGGANYLVIGILAALLEAGRTGVGQVIDASVLDGTAHLLTLIHTLLGSGQWVDRRASNLVDGGVPFYSVYETADGAHMAVGALEPKFFRELVRRLGLPPERIDPTRQYEQAEWPAMRQELAAAFRSRTRAQWTEEFDGSDACVTPVLSLTEAAEHPHVAARATIVKRDGRLHTAVAPRFSGHTQATPGLPPTLGMHTREVLVAAGVDVDSLLDAGIAVQAEPVSIPAPHSA